MNGERSSISVKFGFSHLKNARGRDVSVSGRAACSPMVIHVSLIVQHFYDCIELLGCGHIFQFHVEAGSDT